MESWKSELITCKEIERNPELKGWSMWKINTLRSRFKIIPEPIIRPHITQSKKEPWKVVTRGRLILYPVYIIDYLKKIDRLKKDEKLTYHELKDRPEIKIELEKFRLLKETELKIDSRVKDIGFFANFESAKINLKKVYKWTGNSIHTQFLDKISSDCNSLRKEYYQVNKQMRKQTLNEYRINEELRRKKQEVGLKLDYLYILMQAVIDQGKSLLDQKLIKIEDWFEPIKRMDLKER